MNSSDAHCVSPRVNSRRSLHEIFTFENTGQPCCMISKGARDGKIIYFAKDPNSYDYTSDDDKNDSESESENNDDKEPQIDEDSGSEEVLVKKKKNQPRALKKKKVKKLTNKPTKKKTFSYLKLEGAEHFIPIPRYDRRSTGYIAGPQGSGKSTFISAWVKLYQLIYPKHPFYLFSGLDKDETLDKRNPQRIILDEGYAAEPIEPSAVKDSLCVFDDIDGIMNKAIKNSVFDTMNNLLAIGRHSNVSVLGTMHQLLSSLLSKVLLQNSDFVVFFPKFMVKTQPNRFLKDYLGCSVTLTKYILNSDSRWVYCWKVAPNFVMTENELYSCNFMEEALNSSEKKVKKKKK